VAWGVPTEYESSRAPPALSSNFPSDPSASFNAQNRKNAMAFRQTSSGAVGEFVNAMRQLTQSVNVVASVSVMCSNWSRMMRSIVSNASCTMARSSSLAACVKIMNMLFHPLLTLSTWPLTICDVHRMISSRISGDSLCRMSTTNGLRNSFWKE